MVIERFDVYLVNLDPTGGSEMRKTRPCLIISPNEMNRFLATIIVAPMTTRRRSYPTRVPVRFQGKAGEIALDQIRVADRRRLIERLGRVSRATQEDVLDRLAALFSP